MVPSSQCVSDCWGALRHRNAFLAPRPSCASSETTGMPGAILSCKMVAACGFSSHYCVTKQTSSKKEKFRILSFREQKKKQGSKEAAKKL